MSASIEPTCREGKPCPYPKAKQDEGGWRIICTQCQETGPDAPEHALAWVLWNTRR